MTLDAQTAALLRQMEESGQPPLYELSVAAARDALRDMSRLLDIAPVPVGRCSDRTIPGPGGEVPVRIYSPDAAEGAGTPPILMLFHGGGFAAGDLDTHDPMARYYCAHGGVIVVSVDYRRSPEHKFPAAVNDCFAALSWAAGHGDELGGDTTRIAVTGDSAGGNLAAVVSLLARDCGGPVIAAQILAYPVVDMHLDADYASRTKFGDGDYFLSRNDMAWLTDMYLERPDQADDVRASPMLAEDLSGLAPALILTAGHDPLADEGRAYGERLKAAGVPVEHVCFEGTIHGFLSFAGALDAGKQGLARVARRLADLGRG